MTNDKTAAAVVVAVTGGRNYNDRARVFAVLDEVHETTPIARLVHGACGLDASKSGGTMRGADRWADEWAKARGIEHCGYPADWSHGRTAGPARNAHMLDTERPDLLVVFPGGRGTESCMRLAWVREIALTGPGLFE